MAKIDLGGLTAAIPEAVQNLSDMIKKDAFTYGDLMQTITLVPNVSYAKKIGLLGKIAAIGKTKSGTSCTLNTVTANITATEKSWAPIEWNTRLIFCKDDIENTIAMKTLKKGVEAYDLTETEYMEMYVDRLIEAIEEMYWRIVWFGDKDAANTDDSPAGYITATEDITLLNMIDGLWKRARTIIGTTPAQRVTIAANAEATTAAQDAAFTAALALTYSKNIFFNAPLEIRNKMKRDNYVAYCTQAYFDKLLANFQTFDLESMKKTLEDGAEALMINGIPFVPVPEWDEMIETYEDLGAKYRDPFRCICYSKENALVGVPDVATWGEFDAFYDRTDKKVYIDLADKIDALFLHDNMIMVAI